MPRDSKKRSEAKKYRHQGQEFFVSQESGGFVVYVILNELECETDDIVYTHEKDAVFFAKLMLDREREKVH